MNIKAGLNFILLFIQFALQGRNISAPQNPVVFFPLKTGNVWVYEYYSPTPPPNGTRYRFKSLVIKDSLINGHRYYFLTNTKYISYFDTLNWFRTDSVNGNFLAYKPGLTCRPGYEMLIDSLGSDSNDISQICSFPLSSRRCYNTGIAALFNYQVHTKVFNFTAIIVEPYMTYSENFGIISCYTAEMGEYTYILLGCIINGFKYGDTTLIGINKLSSEIPLVYNLHQNYPNPFNPTTKISFDIPVGNGRDHSVQLKIYDILGREVATLVTEQLKPGTYEVEWDGSHFASGVYFYSLVVNDASAPLSTSFTKTNKIILLK